MLQHLIIQFLLYYLSSGRLQEFKNESKFQIFSSKSGRSHLWEVVANKKFQILWFDSETFGILENWSLRRGSHLREVFATEGSIVMPTGAQILSAWLKTCWIYMCSVDNSNSCSTLFHQLHDPIDSYFQYGLETGKSIKTFQWYFNTFWLLEKNMHWYHDSKMAFYY